MNPFKVGDLVEVNLKTAGEEILMYLKPNTPYKVRIVKPLSKLIVVGDLGESFGFYYYRFKRYYSFKDACKRVLKDKITLDETLSSEAEI